MSLSQESETIFNAGAVFFRKELSQISHWDPSPQKEAAFNGHHSSTSKRDSCCSKSSWRSSKTVLYREDCFLRTLSLTRWSWFLALRVGCVFTLKKDAKKLERVDLGNGISEITDERFQQVVKNLVCIDVFMFTVRHLLWVIKEFGDRKGDKGGERFVIGQFHDSNPMGKFGEIIKNLMGKRNMAWDAILKRRWKKIIWQFYSCSRA